MCITFDLPRYLNLKPHLADLSLDTFQPELTIPAVFVQLLRVGSESSIPIQSSKVL